MDGGPGCPDRLKVGSPDFRSKPKGSAPALPMAQRFRRRRKLIRPGLQLRLSAKFVGLIALMLGLQFVLLDALIGETAAATSDGAASMSDQMWSVGVQLLGWSAVVFLPLTLLVGVIASFRFAGPLYRFDVFLKAVAAGEQPEDIRLRSGDELKELATLLNEATRPLREDSQATNSPELSRGGERQAAA